MRWWKRSWPNFHLVCEQGRTGEGRGTTANGPSISDLGHLAQPSGIIGYER